MTAAVDVRRLDSESKLAHKTALPLAGELTRDAGRSMRGLTGGERLLVALVRQGLPAESLHAAAALCIALDKQPEADLQPQTDEQRLESRARVYTGRAT